MSVMIQRFHLLFFVSTLSQFDCVTLRGLATKNDIGDQYKEHIMKFIPVLRQYKLDRAAQHLQSWVLGTLERQPLLDVSAKLG